MFAMFTRRIKTLKEIKTLKYIHRNVISYFAAF